MAIDTERRRGFPETHLSMVAGIQSDDPDVRAHALGQIARAYYGAVYLHVRLKWSKSPAESEDLAQAFFEHAITKDVFSQFDPGRGRFRTFVRTIVDRVALVDLRAARRQKRGGGAAMFSFDAASVEAEIARLTPEVDVEQAFDAEFRRGLVARSVQALEQQLEAEGKRVYFEVFQRFDLHDEDGPRPTYADLAAALGLKTTDVTNYLAAARRRLKLLLTEELRDVTSSDGELEEEARALGIA